MLNFFKNFHTPLPYRCKLWVYQDMLENCIPDLRITNTLMTLTYVGKYV